jgi:inorganic triphosphatase YgiF
MSIETEIKLTLDPEFCSRVPRLEPVIRFARGAPRVQALTSIYYDTVDLELLAHRVAFRIRMDGDQIIQTVKGRRAKAGLLHARVEYEWELSHPHPDVQRVPREAPFDILHERGIDVLREIFRTEFQRTAWLLEPEPGVLIECALDVGQVTAGERMTPLSEVELELKAGEPRHVLALAKVFADVLPMRLEQVSKAQRGYALVSPPPLPGSVRAHRFKLSPTATTQEAFQGILDEAFQQIIANDQAVRWNDDPEGVHQMRIGFRRYLAILQAFRSFLQKKDRRMLRKQIKPFLTLLSAARDWDILSAGAQGASPSLVVSLAQEQKLRRSALRKAMDEPAYTRMMLALACWMATMETPAEASGCQPLAAVASSVLVRGHRQIRKRGRQVKKRSLQACHRLRLACKQQWYTLDCFQALYPGDKVVPYLQALRDLQDLLGALNDTVSLLDRHAAVIKGMDDKAGQTALFRQVSQHQAKLLEQLPVAWAAFNRQPTGW